jgi:hypothetical protein
MIPHRTILALVGAFLSGTALAGDVSVQQVRGDGLSWYTVVYSGCTQQWSYLTASEEVQKGSDVAGAPIYGTEITYSGGTFDFCTFQTLSSVSGTSTLGVVDLDGDSGVIDATVPVFDYATGTMASVAIDLILIGAGDVTHAIVHTVNDLYTEVRVTRANGTFQSATVSGSIGDAVFDEVGGATLTSYTDGTQTRTTR